jgi:RNA polymerase sigma-70 factor (ECF subfamily)
MLKPKYRSVIVMRDIQDLAYEEIATILKLPMGTVKSQISRARARLRETIASMLEGGEGA